MFNKPLHNRYVILTVFFMLVSLLASNCKTKKAPPMLVLREHTVVIQVCDKFQMSYDGLPCFVYFSDGTNIPYTTAIDGKIIVKLNNPLVSIEKVVYNFATYTPRAGTLLAKEDFKLATRIPSKATAKEVMVPSPFSDKTKNLFVLVR
ncbi:MAG: hypothetical protein ACTTKH_02045 [Treponema sp.]